MFSSPLKTETEVMFHSLKCYHKNDVYGQVINYIMNWRIHWSIGTKGDVDKYLNSLLIDKASIFCSHSVWNTTSLNLPANSNHFIIFSDNLHVYSYFHTNARQQHFWYRKWLDTPLFRILTCLCVFLSETFTPQRCSSYGKKLMEWLDDDIKLNLVKPIGVCILSDIFSSCYLIITIMK